MDKNIDTGYEADTEVKKDKKIKNISNLLKFLSIS